MHKRTIIQHFQLLSHVYDTERAGGRFAVIILGKSVIWEKRFPSLLEQSFEYARVSRVLHEFKGDGYRVVSCDACASRTLDDVVALNNDACPVCGRRRPEALRLVHYLINASRTFLDRKRLIDKSSNVVDFVSREKARRNRVYN
jgi:hypothetical protein